jgi:myo-inositol-1(or 4)-monophosphatase
VLIVQEAGGKVTDFKGGPFQLDSRETLASNGLVHQALLNEFEQVFSGQDLEPLPDVQEYRK